MLRANYIIKYSLLFIFLVFLQVTILNKISFFNIATPIVYIYLIIKLPIALNRNLILFIGFALGFTIDVFCNTPGINAAATTLIAFLRRPIHSLFFAVNDFEEQEPSLRSQKSVFVKYTIVMVFIHHLVLMAIESFSMENFKIVLLRIFASTILTTLLIFAFEGLSVRSRKE